MNLQKRSYKKELLDQDDIPFEDIKRNMQELNFINTWLGGHAISINGLKELIGKQRSLSICEIGCGGGDNLVALHNWCIKQHIEAKFIGIDIKPACIGFAQTRATLKNITDWIESDYSIVSFKTKPDIIFSSLFCHHFTDEQLVAQLEWMKQNSKLGFFINDLERNSLAMHLIKWLTKIFSSSYLVKNDAPLSVARGFKKNEWMQLLNRAKIPNYSVQWKWAFRYLVTYRHG
jgi:2-polyprenyl-3-methyl-5-hydroxy-6-metoxy-1,4-benzoquinol methylase